MTAQRRPGRLWSIEDLSEYLGIPVPTLHGWRTKGYGPPARKVGKHLRYDPEKVREWFERLGGGAA